MTENGGAIITITFGSIVGLIYIVAILMAFLSWRKYRYSKLVFIPMLLLLIYPTAIFPIYSYAEYKIRKRNNPSNSCEAKVRKLKFYISWVPMISGIVSSWIFAYTMWYILNRADVSGHFNSTMSYFICLLFVAAFIWLGCKLDKMTTDTVN